MIHLRIWGIIFWLLIFCNYLGSRFAKTQLFKYIFINILINPWSSNIFHLTLKDLYFSASSVFLAFKLLNFSANLFVSGISYWHFNCLPSTLVDFSFSATLFSTLSSIILDILSVISACIEWYSLLNYVSSLSRAFFISECYFLSSSMLFFVYIFLCKGISYWIVFICGRLNCGVERHCFSVFTLFSIDVELYIR